MAAVAAPQAISGVSAGREGAIETVYPSIAASGFGRFLGTLMESIPVRIRGVKLSYIVFAPLVAPLGAVGYLKMKAFDPIYVLTNRTLQLRSPLSGRLLQQVSLADIGNIAVVVQPGQQAYQAGDLEVLNAKGDVVLTLGGVPRPERFRQVILDAREARVHNDRALDVIRSRG